MVLRKLNYIFLCSNFPVPRTNQFVKLLKDKKIKSYVFYINRMQGLVRGTVNSDYFEFQNKFQPLSIQRVIAVFKFFRYVNNILIKKTAENYFIFHVDSLDLYFISLLFKFKYKGAKIVFEVRDLHKLQVSGMFRYFFNCLEWVFMIHLDILIITSPKYYSYYYRKIYKGQVYLIENIPDLREHMILTPEKKEILTIGYVGVIRYPVQMLNLVYVIKKLNTDGLKIKLKVWGGIATFLNEEIIAAFKSSNMIEYFGAFNYTQDIYEIFNSFDILYSVYDTDFINVQLAIPNKYYEALFFRKPIIVSSNTYLSEIVKREGIGIGVNSNSIEELNCAIKDLFDVDLNWVVKSKINLSKRTRSELNELFSNEVSEYFKAVNKL
jgi:succinoglycan biosynthesis protein ExoL